MGHKEKVTETGRTVNMRLRPFRQVKNNKLEVQVWINITNLTDIEREIDGVKVTLNQGRVQIKIDAFVIQSLRGSFDTRPEYLIIKNIFDKFLFKSKAKDYEGMVRSDAVDLKSEIESFLNLNKFLF